MNGIIMELQSVLRDCGLRAIILSFGDNFYFTLSNQVELTTLTIIRFADFARKNKCVFSVSNYCDKLTFSFRF